MWSCRYFCLRPRLGHLFWIVVAVSTARIVKSTSTLGIRIVLSPIAGLGQEECCYSYSFYWETELKPGPVWQSVYKSVYKCWVPQLAPLRSWCSGALSTPPLGSHSEHTLIWITSLSHPTLLGHRSLCNEVFFASCPGRSPRIWSISSHALVT